MSSSSFFVVSRGLWQRNYWQDQEVFCCAEHQTGSSKKELNKQASCFSKHWLWSSFLTFPASQCRLHWGPASELAGTETLFHFWFPAHTPCVHHYTEQQLYWNNNMLFQRRQICEIYIWNGKVAEERSRWAKTEQADLFFFFFSTEKMAIETLLRLPVSSSILQLDVCAQTLTHTRSDTFTCNFNSDKRTEHDCDVFYNCFSENVLHLFPRWRTPHKRFFFQKKTINKSI